jgi:hypothetical protein
LEELLSIIGNVGFPIAVSAYLLIRIEAKLGQLTSAITQLREAIITLPSRDCLRASPLGTTPVRTEAITLTNNSPVV